MAGQGDDAKFPSQRWPYVRVQQHGQAYDLHGNQLPTAEAPEAHIPLELWLGRYGGW